MEQVLLLFFLLFNSAVYACAVDPNYFVAKDAEKIFQESEVAVFAKLESVAVQHKPFQREAKLRVIKPIKGVSGYQHLRVIRDKWNSCIQPIGRIGEAYYIFGEIEKIEGKTLIMKNPDSISLRGAIDWDMTFE